MDVPLTQSGMEIIPRRECLQLLAGRRVGRLGFLIGDQPMVLPVNFGISGDVVVLRTGEGTKLDASCGRKVAFEVDDVDTDAHTGWSVVVQGIAEDITDAEDWFAESLRAESRPTWLPGSPGHYLRITPTLVTGRRVRAAPAVSDDEGPRAPGAK